MTLLTDEVTERRYRTRSAVPSEAYAQAALLRVPCIPLGWR